MMKANVRANVVHIAGDVETSLLVCSATVTVETSLVVRGGIKHLDKEIKDILGSKREPTLFLNWYKKGVRFVFRTYFSAVIYARARGHCEIPAEMPEDSRVLRVRCLWFSTFDRLETWLIPSGTTLCRQYCKSAMVRRNLPLYHRL